MTTTKTLLGYSINNGPNRTDLIYAFIHAKDNLSESPISFEIVEDHTASDDKEACRIIRTCNTKIVGLKYDGDSQCAFVIEGSMDIFHFVSTHNETYMSPLSCKFTACYDATTRKGRAVFLVPS